MTCLGPRTAWSSRSELALRAPITAVFLAALATGLSNGEQVVPGAWIRDADGGWIYRRMNIGTAKPSIDAQREIPHHLIDVAEPSEDFSVAQYVELADRAIADIHHRRRPIFVVGGAPLYVKALIEGLFEGPSADPTIRRRLQQQAAADGLGALHARLQAIDPTAASRIHPNDERRIVRALEVHELTGTPISALQSQWDRQRQRYDCRMIGLRREREDQNHRTNERVRRMIDTGLVAEVRGLLAEPTPLGTTACKALGYAEIIDHLEDRVSLADAVEMIKISTRRLAKAQRTWFKRFIDTDWVDLAPDATAEQVADGLMERYRTTWSQSPR